MLSLRSPHHHYGAQGDAFIDNRDYNEDKRTLNNYKQPNKISEFKVSYGSEIIEGNEIGNLLKENRI